MRGLTIAAVAGVGLAIMIASPVSSQTQTSSPRAAAGSTMEKVHRVIIQVTQNDPAVMTMALNNAENLVQYFNEKGEKIEVEFVAYGAGLSMVRNDVSPVKDRLAAMTGMKNVTFSGCNNTLGKQSKIENKEISLIPGVRLVDAGIARVVELQEEGWTYVRP